MQLQDLDPGLQRGTHQTSRKVESLESGRTRLDEPDDHQRVTLVREPRDQLGRILARRDRLAEQALPQRGRRKLGQSLVRCVVALEHEDRRIGFCKGCIGAGDRTGNDLDRRFRR